MEDKLIEDPKSPRKRWIAFLLSVAVPGLGQLYNGQAVKSIGYALGMLILGTATTFSGLKVYFWVYAPFLIFAFVARIAIAIEATIVAGRNKNYQVRKYNKWYVYLLLVVMWLMIGYAAEKLITHTRYQTFRVGSLAGEPNLFIGEYVLGDTEFFDSKSPEYGDLVFLSTERGMFYYRIVGLPSDTLSLENNRLKYKNKKSASIPVSTSMIDGIETEEFVETLPNGVKYHIYRNKTVFDAEKATIKDIIVPKNAYFLLGDNRDNAEDSRYLGFIQRQQIKGKLLTIFFSTDFSRINKSLTK